MLHGTLSYYNTGFKRQIAQTGRIPQGTYSACITVVNLDGADLVRNTCQTFTIVYPDPPHLVSFVNGDSVTSSYPVFWWTPTQVRDVDYFGGQSPPSGVSTAEIEELKPIPPGGLRASVTPRGILVQWDKTLQPALKEYRVYRYERRERPVRISYVPASRELEAPDRGARRGILYFLFVTSLNTKGIESDRSREVGIRR